MDRRYIWGALAAAAVVVAVLIGFSLAGGSGDAPTDLEGVAEIRATFGDLPADGLTVGDPDAPVEIIEFGDLQCPACAQAATNSIPELVERYVEPGDVRLTYQPIAFIGPDSERGALGAVAAAQQDKIWPFIELLYRNQGGENSGWLSDATMENAVEALELDADRWRADYDDSGVVVPPYRAAQELAGEEAVDSTPTFIVRGPDGEETIEGAANIDVFADAIATVGGPEAGA